MAVSYSEINGKPVEILTENVCFRIDSEFRARHALALLSSIQSYIQDCRAKTESWNKVYKQNRVHKLNLMIVCERLPMLQFLVSWLKKESLNQFRFRSDLNGFTIHSSDYYVDITLAKLEAVCNVGRLHIVQGIGTLIGCNAGSIANLSGLDKHSFMSGTLVLANCSDIITSIKALETMLPGKFKEVWAFDAGEEEEMSPEILSIIHNSEAVIGRRGFCTYAGSCLGKPVLELVEIKDSFEFLTQWSNRYYTPMVLGPKVDIQRGVKRLWDTVVMFRGSLTGMEVETSIANATVED